MENKVDIITKEKFDGYSNNLDNYQAEGELMVTITLNEYRQLLQQAAAAKTAEERSKWLEEYNKRTKLEEKVEALQTVIAGMTKEPEKEASESETD